MDIWGWVTWVTYHGMTMGWLGSGWVLTIQRKTSNTSYSSDTSSSSDTSGLTTTREKLGCWTRPMKPSTLCSEAGNVPAR
jgi:hypothetical protein